MIFWKYFWTVLFFGGLSLFAILAVVITIGGFFNILSLFRDLGKTNRQEGEKE